MRDRVEETLKQMNIWVIAHEPWSGIKDVITSEQDTLFALKQTEMLHGMTGRFEHFEVVIPHFDPVALMHDSDPISVIIEKLCAP